MRRVSYRMLVLYIVLGAIIGSFIGEFIGWILPPGVVNQFFVRHITVGIDPTLLNLKVLTLTVGFTFTLNIAGLIGLVIAVYMLRWYR